MRLLVASYPEEVLAAAAVAAGILVSRKDWISVACRAAGRSEMFGVRVLKEEGSVVEKAVADRNFNPVMKGIDAKEYPVMGTLDPYGDTSLNYLQCALLIEELQRGRELLVQVGVQEDSIAELTRLCHLARAEPHRKLVFIGD